MNAILRPFSNRTSNGRTASERGAAAPGPDAALARAAQENPAAFDAIYRAYVSRIYRYCFARLRDPVLAEDATSQTFLNALASIHRFKTGSLSAWLFTIARNVTIDQARARNRSFAGDGAPNFDRAHEPEQATIDSDEDRRLRLAMDSLNKDQRAAIELQLAGWSLAQSSEAMGKSVAAIKMLRVRAIARLRHVLSDDNEGALR